MLRIIFSDDPPLAPRSLVQTTVRGTKANRSRHLKPGLRSFRRVQHRLVTTPLDVAPPEVQIQFLTSTDSELLLPLTSRPRRLPRAPINDVCPRCLCGSEPNAEPTSTDPRRNPISFVLDVDRTTRLAPTRNLSLPIHRPTSYSICSTVGTFDPSCSLPLLSGISSNIFQLYARSVFAAFAISSDTRVLWIRAWACIQQARILPIFPTCSASRWATRARSWKRRSSLTTHVFEAIRYLLLVLPESRIPLGHDSWLLRYLEDEIGANDNSTS